MKKKSPGFTLIEMLVGIVIGMIVVAAASVMMVSVLKSQKDITASARLNQELGAAMAVMSNEIRRAGFRVCDMKKMHDATPSSVCPDNNSDGEEDPFISTYGLGEDIKVGDGGNCIEYRYNADLDNDVPNTLGEQRAFRFNINKIQVSKINQNVTCADLDPVKWENLTDENVINITALSFSTTGSKCRNMTEGKKRYWVVGDSGTGMACDPATTPVVCTDLGGGCGALAVSGDDVFGIHQIQINLESELAKDPSVFKKLKSSVKVANPWIGKVP